MKKLIAGIICFGLMGCSTTPVSPTTAKEVPVILKFQKREGTVPVTVVRDKGMIASACAITAYIDGGQVANLDTGEKFVAYVKPGEVVVGAGFIGSGLCSGAPRKERMFTVKDGKPIYLRIFIDQSANVDILPSTIN